MLKNRLGVRIYARGLDVYIAGEPDKVRQATQLIKQLVSVIRRTGYLEEEVFEHLVESGGVEAAPGEYLPHVPGFAPKTEGQKRYLEAMEKSPIVMCYGPAGTGKTYLAVAMAISFLKRRQVNRIVLTRPAVEAGESLGYLPGTMAEKVHPYLIPLFDALNDLIGFDRSRRLIERGVVEVAPLAFMRGRSLNHSFIILDEAQNTTRSQMKMFLTRMGNDSRIVVTADPTQIDLEDPRQSGFAEARRVLRGVEGVEFVELTDRDVVRHPVVQRIINAYRRYEEQERLERGQLIELGETGEVSEGESGAGADPESGGEGASHG